MSRFAGKVAIVTGAASGIGAATARRLAAEGASVVVADIQDERGAALAAGIVAAGDRALYQRCDVAARDDWLRLAALARDRFGPIDVVHNNAFTIVREPAHRQSDEDWDRQLAVCLRQVLHSVVACIDDLRTTSGAIVNTASVHARIGLPSAPAYAAAKGGLCALTRQLAVEYGPEVRVNAVLPGAIETPVWDGVPASERAATIAQTPARRFGSPDDVAACVCFLASAEAAFVTGESLVVDGGWSIAKP